MTLLPSPDLAHLHPQGDFTMLDPLSRRGFFASLLAAVFAALGWRRPSPAADAPTPVPPAPPVSSYYPIGGTVTTLTYDIGGTLISSSHCASSGIVTYTYDACRTHRGTMAPSRPASAR
jgi:hypothetical protein